jgi:hypothetical protein
MKLLKLFKLSTYLHKKSETLPEPESESLSKYAGFDLEYHPSSEMYYIRYKKQEYLCQDDGPTNSYRLSYNKSAALYTRSKNFARQYLDEFLEFKGIGTESIPVE